MPNIHKILKGGGEEFLPFALAQERKLRMTGLQYAVQAFEVGDAKIRVRIEGDHSFIEIEGGIGGYGIVGVSALYTPTEFSVINDIRKRDANPPVPPYKRSPNRYKSINVSYWVGGSDRKKPKVSHVNLDTNSYAVDGRPATRWGGSDQLVKVAWIEESKLWVYITVAPDLESYSVHGVSPVTNTMGTLAALDVGTDGKIRQDDLGQVDVSPDGKKIMFVWSEEDQTLFFRKRRFVREYGIASPPDAPPIFSTSPVDKDVSDRTVSDTRDPDTGSVYGTIVDEKHDFFGYDWKGVLKYATIETSFSVERGVSNPNPNPNPGPGAYPLDDGQKTLRRALKVGGATVRQAVGVGTATGVYVARQALNVPPPVADNPWTLEPESITTNSSMTADDFVLSFFDPRSGAYAITRGTRTTNTTVAHTYFEYEEVGYDVGDVIGSTTVTNASGASAAVYTFVFGTLTKDWELTAASSTSTSNTAPITGPIIQGNSAPAPEVYLGAVASSLTRKFASRRPGEGVLSFFNASKRVFAVIGQKNDVADFISEDASGLPKHIEAGFYVAAVYPI